MSTSMSWAKSWPKILVALYLIANIKSFPFVWHLRVFYHFVRNISRRPIPPPRPSSQLVDSTHQQGRGHISAHPVFQPTSITTRSPLLECDYNMHKSNSTYFTDMDVSRTKLAVRLITPGWRTLNAELEGEGHRGRMLIALGGVHTSFRKEVGIYEKVEVRSRVCTWDSKWIVMISYFVRHQGSQEELCAVGLSKYVCKKGRYTVRPERLLLHGGWLPTKPDQNGSAIEQNKSVQKDASDANDHRRYEPIDPQVKKIGDPSEDDAVSVTDAMPNGTEKVIWSQEQASESPQNTDLGTRKSIWNANDWTWAEIEDERERGLQFSRKWLTLDADLYDEFNFASS